MIVSGQVLEKKARIPVPNTLISAVAGTPGGEGLTSSLTDAAGKYSLLLPSGDSHIYIASRSPDFEYPDRQEVRNITVAEGRVIKGELNFELLRREQILPPGVACTAKGRVVDAGGNGIPNVPLSFNVTPLPGHRDGMTMMTGGPLGITNADGTYEVKLDAYSDYQISAGGVLHSSVHSKSFQTGSGTTHNIENLALRPATASAAGVVINERGEPVKGVIVEPSSKNKYAPQANEVRTDAAGAFQAPHLLADEPFQLYLRKQGHVARTLYGLQPGVTDYRILLPHQTNPEREIDYDKHWEDGKRLIGKPAPAWDVSAWIQKQEPAPAPKRDDGRWIIFIFIRDGDPDGATLRKLSDAAQSANAAAVAIFASHFDEHLPKRLLAANPFPFTAGLDRFTFDSGTTETSATRLSYGDRSIYIIDPSGIVRAATSKWENIASLIGK